ncbi:MAG TPA: sigma factor [Longimicrobium sp.]|nr:sigma factor [Longimicrobium sp.]
MKGSFHERFAEVFEAQFPRVFRYIDRQSGDAELAADVAQDAFVRLYRRGSLPDAPEAWLITVAQNLFRNARTRTARRRRLLTVERGGDVMADPPPSPQEILSAGEDAARVRGALDRLAERDRQMLILRAEASATGRSPGCWGCTRPAWGRCWPAPALDFAPPTRNPSMHLDVEQIERLAAGELDPGQEGPLRAHVQECAMCGRRLAAATAEDAEVTALIRGLDHPVPQLRVGAIVARAAPVRPGWMRMAAVLALTVLASGVLYAVPGSPLRALLRRAAEWVSPGRTAAPETAPSPPSPTPAPAPAGAEAAGVAVVPGAELAIVFASPQASGAITVRLVESPEASVQVLGAQVSFDVDTDRITVANAGAAADYRILLPRGAPRVRVQVGGATVLRKDGARITAAAAPDSSGAYVIPLHRDAPR